MNIRKISLSAVAITLAFGLALPTSALTITNVTDTAVDAAGDVTTRVNADGTTNASVSAQGNAGIGATSTGSGTSGSGSAQAGGNATVSGDAGFGASIRAMLSSLINGSTSTTADNGAQDEDTTDGSAGIGSEVSSSIETVLVTRADLDNGSVNVSTNNAAAVNNAAEIRSYIAAELQNDSNLESVEVAQDAVEVTYKQKAHLFAFIPVMVNATAIVEANGDVRVSYPWYSFLMSTDKDELEAKIESRIADLVDAMADVSAALEANAGADGASATVDAEMAARVTARAQAMLVSEVKAAMAETLAAAEAATDAEANANANANAAGSVSTQ